MATARETAGTVRSPDREGKKEIFDYRGRIDSSCIEYLYNVGILDPVGKNSTLNGKIMGKVSNGES